MRLSDNRMEVKMKKILCIFIASLMLFGCVSCNKRDVDEEQSNTETEKEVNTELVADVPEVDMDGKIFTIVTDNWWGNPLAINDDFSSAMISGDIVGDAQYAARTKVCARFNCNLSEVNFSGPTESVTKIRGDYDAGDNAYDIYLSRIMYWQTLAQEGVLRDLNSAYVSYLDFSKPWWDDNSARELSILGQLYCVVGDISLQDEYWTSCIAFNKKIVENYGLDNPYDMVKSNNWTFESFYNLSKTYSEDVDNNGVWDENDNYGFLYQRDTLNAMIVASGGAYARKDADDVPYITLKSAGDIIDAAMDVLYAPSSLQVMNLTDYISTRDAMFKNDQALFSYFCMVSLEQLRKMETDFGILPVPKYSAEQTEWYSEASSWSCGVIALPVQNSGKNLENTCIFLEALACENRKQVMPAYYDTLLNGIVVRDPESSEMLDLIFENRKYDIGACCNFGSLTQIIYLTMDGSRDYSSYIGGRELLAKKEVQAMVKKFNELKVG